MDYKTFRKGIEVTDEDAVKILKDHVENDVIKEAVIYKTPLEKYIPKAEAIFFHAYLVYRACNKKQTSLCHWWSVEKTGSSYELQRSEYLVDVANLAQNKPRLGDKTSADDEGSSVDRTKLIVGGNPYIHHGMVYTSALSSTNLQPVLDTYKWAINKEEPQVCRQDRCKEGASPLTVLQVMNEEKGYFYTENNCKRFAKKIFNEIADCKTWNPIAP